MLGSELLRYKDSQKYLIKDIESNSLNLFFGLPWELSYAVANNKSIESIHTRYILWPNFKISDETAAINHFNKRLYEEKGEKPEVVWADFSQLLYDKDIRVVGHNIIGFDFYMLNAWCNGMGIKLDHEIVRRFIDTLCLSKAYKCNILPDNDNFTNWQCKLTNFWPPRGVKTSLGAMCKELGIEYDTSRAHGAEYDIQVNFEVFKQLLWKLEI